MMRRMRRQAFITLSHISKMFLLSGLLSAFVLGANAAELILAERGKPSDYTIVKPVKSSPSQSYAAEELQRFVAELTGVKLEITTDEHPLSPRAILLGNTRYTTAALGTEPDWERLGADGFRIATRGQHLLIVGSAVRGTLYGVYEVLERFGGCRWYASWYSVIPKLDALRVPALDETQTPAFAMREPYWFDMFNGDLAARNKVNGNRMELTAKHGGKSYRFGGGLFVHTFDPLCPVKEFFETHPEYFSEVDGARLKERTQLCLTNPDVLRIVTKRVLERIRKDPAAKLFSVSQNDWRNPCACPRCKALDEAEGSHAGTLITFVNQVAEAVEKEFPHVWIETLAYQYTRKPPKTVRPRHNVVVRLCTIECDFARPLPISDYRENQSFVEDIQGWSAISSTLFIWDYVTNFRDYLAPFPNVLALRDNVRFFRDNHVVGLFEQGAYQGRHADFAELKAWLLAKWLWNPELPMEPLLEDFFAGYYGAAAPLVRQYFDDAHSHYGVTTNAPLRIFYDIKHGQLSPEFYQRACEVWRRAEETVKDDPARSYNVRMGAMPALYGRLVQLAPQDDGERIWVTADPRTFQTPLELQGLAATLLVRCNEAKNIRLAENQERHNTMLNKFRKLSEPVVIPEKGRLVVEVEDKELRLAQSGKWGEIVADPLAEDGSALKLFNTHYEWCVTLPFYRVVFDKGENYRLRVKVRVERERDGQGAGFWAGVHDPKAHKSVGGVSPRLPDMKDGYQWFEVAEWVPESQHYFWIGPGRFDKQKLSAHPGLKALYIDKIEISRVNTP